MHKLYLLVIISYYTLNSCTSFPVISGGTLGALKQHNFNACDKEKGIKEIDSLVISTEFVVPDSLENKVKWDEKGYDFLTHWTIYYEYENQNYLIMFTTPKDEFSLAIRASFDFNSNEWIYAADIPNDEAEIIDNSFVIVFVNKLNCW